MRDEFGQEAREDDSWNARKVRPLARGRFHKQNLKA
jgi:hypothetical protein